MSWDRNGEREARSQPGGYNFVSISSWPHCIRGEIHSNALVSMLMIEKNTALILYDIHINSFIICIQVQYIRRLENILSRYKGTFNDIGSNLLYTLILFHNHIFLKSIHEEAALL